MSVSLLLLLKLEHQYVFQWRKGIQRKGKCERKGVRKEFSAPKEKRKGQSEKSEEFILSNRDLHSSW